MSFENAIVEMRSGKSVFRSDCIAHKEREYRIKNNTIVCMVKGAESVVNSIYLSDILANDWEAK